MPGDALVEDVPRSQTEVSRDEHADAQSETRKSEDAACQALHGSVGKQTLHHHETLPTALSHPPGSDSTMLLSSRCSACGCVGDVLCHRCRFSLASVAAIRSPDGIAAAFPFEGVARQLIVALKFRHRRSAAGVLAAHMVARLGLDSIDVVTWAPTSARRVRDAAMTRPRRSPKLLLVSWAFRAVGSCIGPTVGRKPVNREPTGWLVPMLITFSDTIGLAVISFPDTSISLWGGDESVALIHFLKNIGVMLLLFWIVASVFLFAGSAVGYYFSRIPALKAYSWDLLGSLLGVIVLTLITSRNAGPQWWLLPGCIALVFLPGIPSRSSPPCSWSSWAGTQDVTRRTRRTTGSRRGSTKRPEPEAISSW